MYNVSKKVLLHFSSQSSHPQLKPYIKIDTPLVNVIS